MKRMKNIPLGILCAMILLVFASCSRNEDAPHAADSPSAQLLSSGQREYIGQMHNAGLDAIAELENFSAAFASTNSPAFDAAAASAIIDLTECESCSETALAEVAANTSAQMAGMTDVEDLADALYDQERINSADHSALMDLNSLVYASSSSSAAEFQSALHSFESDVASASGLSEGGQRAILAGSAVMRYSDTYWRGVETTGTTHAWYGIKQNRDEASPGLIWWVRDLMGAVVAALTYDNWEGDFWGGVRRTIVGGLKASGFM